MNIRFGDVILFSNESNKKGMNKTSQSILRRADVEFSHVALCLTDNLVLHAMPKVGVELKTFESLNKEYGVYKVIRHQELGEKSNDSANAARFMNNACFHLERPYDIKSVVSTKFKDGSIICSNLVATCLKEHGISVRKSESNVLPYDFQVLNESDGWSDVTEQHIEQYEILGYCSHVEDIIQQKMNHRSVDKVLTVAHSKIFKDNLDSEQPEGMGVYWDTKKK
ncbi:hypothetical protein KS872_003810 [Vibrio parahaemolyticus]|uniref:YiiX/YebB-like N1pC/P60 family cysteine hydrolase n=3 Tax=Vibrio parahaemolyticus TaxID=670 RepID=UPI00084B2710|nr:YiiX/YebB-like N1pC/P60 family cysteine hydrolase [Vibrio parahaemolyticus]EHR0574038.1 hypothetical protein [Vibrio parahaemolyticus]EJG1714395.1 hypothetical protein [Vibrio parahaemolyticus]EME0113694.1 hypothetical protein [Vibrio parahaemolyticus]ODZ43591.1 hypothetical protein BBM41_22640 [Vibrio parahaemolyticus]ODZ62159.1 hypothetical protein BBM42_13435 [Vibrio parahaemolyticus]